MVKVPPEYVTDKRVMETQSYFEYEWMLTNIYSGQDKPEDAFTAVTYKGYRFWIDNRDIKSKRNFALLMILMSLTEFGQKRSSPLISIGG